MDIINFFTHLTKLLPENSDPLFAVKTALCKYFFDCGYYFDVIGNLELIFDDFTLNNIISLWANEKILLLQENVPPLCALEKKILTDTLHDKKVNLSHESTALIGEIYQAGLSAAKRKSEGIAYTPEEISEYMTDQIRTLVKKGDTVFDPACGCGTFLSGYYDAMLHRIAMHEDEISIEDAHRDILENRIFACDISEEACAIARVVLAVKYRRCIIPKNIFACDALTDLPDAVSKMHFDFIVMNPPYVGHKKIDKTYASHLKEAYRPVYYDKGDISYCFFYLAGELLKQTGIIVAVTARYFAQSLYGEGLRRYLNENFTFLNAVDFFGKRPFKNIGVDVMILLLRKGRQQNNVFPVIKPSLNDDRGYVFSPYNNMVIYVKQDELSARGFNFLNGKQAETVKRVMAATDNTLGDKVIFFQGIITGCDAAFIVESDSLLYEECIRECGRPWIKSKDIRKGSIENTCEYLLYTNRRDEAKIPATLERLKYYKATLGKRRECVNGARKWYELQWGRKENYFEEEKIVFPYKSANNRFCTDKAGLFFSADVYAAKIKTGVELQSDKLTMLLNSSIYEEYFFTFAKKMGGALYEYYPNTVKNILIPNEQTLNSFRDESDIYDYFGVAKHVR